MKNTKLITMLMAVAPTGGDCLIHAHETGVEYATEWQTDFRGNYNWVNMLRLQGSLDVTEHIRLQAATISVAKTSADPLIDDLQGFSNIEEDNLALAPAVLGAEVNIGRSSLFVGIRNVNEDYFTSPLTSFFTNSSCGIYPTIAANYEIANYPLASWCVHYGYESEHLRIATSLYNGRGFNRFTGSESVFRLTTGRDGVFYIASSEYSKNGSNYNLGFALNYGKCSGDVYGGENASSTQKKKVSLAPWFNVEQRVSERVGVMLQGSMSTLSDGCRYYAGAGAKYRSGRFEAGLFTDYAVFGDVSEWASEMTCRVALTDIISLQPALHVCYDGSKANTVALLRFTLSI